MHYTNSTVHLCVEERCLRHQYRKGFFALKVLKLCNALLQEVVGADTRTALKWSYNLRHL